MKPSILLCSLALSSVTHAALQVTEAPHPNVSPTTQITVAVGNPIPGITTATLQRVDPSTAFFGQFDVSGASIFFFRETQTPPAPNTAIASSSADFYLNQNGSETYQRGATLGTDNWLYITKDAGTKAWAQLEFNTTTATVLRYVHDPANPTADFTLAQAIATVNGPASTDRDIQIRSIDFTTGILELKNFGPDTIPLDGWAFCSHNATQKLKYTTGSGLNGESINSGASLFIHFDNDAPADPDHINRDTIAGAFATPMDNETYSLAIYINTGWNDGNNIADHLQWSRGGVDNNTADERSDEAQAGGVWTHQSSWIVTSAQTEQIILTDTNNGVLHGPNDYLRLPDFQITTFQRFLPSGDIIITFPDVNNLSVGVQKANDITANDWTTLFTTSGDEATIDSQTDPSAYYRLQPLTP